MEEQPLEEVDGRGEEPRASSSEEIGGRGEGETEEANPEDVIGGKVSLLSSVPQRGPESSLCVGEVGRVGEVWEPGMEKVLPGMTV